MKIQHERMRMRVKISLKRKEKEDIVCLISKRQKFSLLTFWHIICVGSSPKRRVKFTAIFSCRLVMRQTINFQFLDLIKINN